MSLDVDLLFKTPYTCFSFGVRSGFDKLRCRAFNPYNLLGCEEAMPGLSSLHVPHKVE